MAINVLILSVEQQEDPDQGQKYPICLTEHKGSSVLEHITENLCGLEPFNVSFAFLENHIKKFHLDNIAKVLFHKSHVVQFPESTQGSACTALYAANTLSQEQPLLIISTNEIVEIQYKSVVDYFDRKGYDGGLLTFSSLHPRYSYVRLDDEDQVIEVAQQSPISKHATAGVFWYKSTRDFIEAAKLSILKGATTNKNYYIAPVFNQMILRQKKIGFLPINEETYIPLKEAKRS